MHELELDADVVVHRGGRFPLYYTPPGSVFLHSMHFGTSRGKVMEKALACDMESLLYIEGPGPTIVGTGVFSPYWAEAAS